MTNNIFLEVVQLPHAAEFDLPSYATEGAAGMDLYAAISHPVVLVPGQRALIPTGIAVGIPQWAEAQIRPRSGLAAKHGITVLNTPGTIDSDFRGEIKVCLINLSGMAGASSTATGVLSDKSFDVPAGKVFTVNPGDRIAQMVVAPIFNVYWVQKEELTSTNRGEGGFGHTGI